MNRYWSEKRVVDKFFNALQAKDYETATGFISPIRNGNNIPTNIPDIP